MTTQAGLNEIFKVLDRGGIMVGWELNRNPLGPHLIDRKRTVIWERLADDPNQEWTETLIRPVNHAQRPRGESRPADVIGNAVRVARIATGEDEETPPPVSPGAALGKLGGQARARNLTAEQKTKQA